MERLPTLVSRFWREMVGVFDFLSK